MPDGELSENKRIVLGAQRSTEAARPEESDPAISLPFPEARTYRWTPVAAANGLLADVLLVVTQDVLQSVSEKVSVSLEREIGGFLLGNKYRCPNSNRSYIVIDQYSPAQFTESSPVSLSFTIEAWAKLADEMTGKFFGKLLVGWYHSHPKMDIFLSSWDVTVHDGRFADAWMSALVIEPEKQLGGFFCRRNGILDTRVPVEFYELLEGVTIESRESLMPWKGYLCSDPITNQEIDPVRRLRRPTTSPVSPRISKPGLPLKPPPGKTLPGAPNGPRKRPGVGIMSAALGGAAALAAIVVLAFWNPFAQHAPPGPVPPSPAKVEVPASTSITRISAELVDSSKLESGIAVALSVENAPVSTWVRVDGKRAGPSLDGDDRLSTMGEKSSRRVKVLANSPNVIDDLEGLMSDAPNAKMTLRIELMDGNTSQVVASTELDVYSRYLRYRPQQKKNQDSEAGEDDPNTEANRVNRPKAPGNARTNAKVQSGGDKLRPPTVQKKTTPSAGKAPTVAKGVDGSANKSAPGANKPPASVDSLGATVPPGTEGKPVADPSANATDPIANTIGGGHPQGQKDTPAETAKKNQEALAKGGKDTKGTPPKDKQKKEVKDKGKDKDKEKDQNKDKDKPNDQPQ